MRELKVTIEKEPDVLEYKVFDDYLEAHKEIAKREEFIFQYNPFNYWHKLEIEGVTYYRFGDVLITPEAYEKLLAKSERVFSIHESDLIRTQRHSNCRYTGDLTSVEDVIRYMREDSHSWLPQIYSEIDEEITNLQKQIDALKLKKQTLQDDNYLRGKIRNAIRVRSEGELT